MKFSDLKSISGLICKLLGLIWQIVVTVKSFIRKKENQEKIDNAHDAIENGDVDKINDMLKNTKK